MIWGTRDALVPTPRNPMICPGGRRGHLNLQQRQVVRGRDGGPPPPVPRSGERAPGGASGGGRSPARVHSRTKRKARHAESRTVPRANR